MSYVTYLACHGKFRCAAAPPLDGTAGRCSPSAWFGFTNERDGQARHPGTPFSSRRPQARQGRVFQTYACISNIALIRVLLWFIPYGTAPSRGPTARDARRSRGRSAAVFGAVCLPTVQSSRYRADVRRGRRPGRLPRLFGPVPLADGCRAAAPCAASDHNSGGTPRIGTGATTCPTGSGATPRAPGSRSPVRSCRDRSACRALPSVRG